MGESGMILVGILIIILMFLLLVLALAAIIIFITALWFIFKKSKQPGYAAIIPFYSFYILNKTARLHIGWTIAVILAALIFIFQCIRIMWFAMHDAIELEDIYVIVEKTQIPMQIAGAVIMVWWAFVSVRLAKLFKRSAEFAIGNGFLPFIFLPVLAFNSNIKYQFNEDEAAGEEIDEEVDTDKTEEISSKY